MKQDGPFYEFYPNETMMRSQKNSLNLKAIYDKKIFYHIQHKMINNVHLPVSMVLKQP